MPKFCKDSADILQHAERTACRFNSLPALIVTWTRADVQSAYRDDNDCPLLSDEQAAEVLAKLEQDFDASIGISEIVIRSCAYKLFPTCVKCGQLENHCECWPGANR